MNDVALSLLAISKAFFGVPVLKEVSLNAGKGRVLGLVGQNGAGKSTLMNIVGGNLAADSGSMIYEGKPYAPANAGEAENLGVAFIHQELNLFSNLSIAENLFLRAMPKKVTRLVDRKELHRRTADLMRDVELDLAPDTLVEQLSPGERQLVEVAKALRQKARIVIFDEPTTSLTPRESARLFEIIGRMKAAGQAIIYISHILSDVVAIADDVAVLRDGVLVASGPTAAFPVSRMIKLMVGRDISDLYPAQDPLVPGLPLLQVRNVTLPGVVRDISFTLRSSEILGVFGLMGSGRTELARLLFGLDQPRSGDIQVGETVYRQLTPHASIRCGMAFITEDRRAEGLMMNMPLSDNIALASLPAFANNIGILDADRLAVSVREFAESIQVKTGQLDQQPARSLSGGNQQKIVIAKWLMAEPRIFLLDEPTRGIDVASKFEIYSIVHALAAKGSGVMLISSEIDEAMAMADRILVMRGGETAGEFARVDFDKEVLLRAAFGETEKAS